MADAFRSGGRLFAFGNGGSSTDAQDVAALFLNPGDPSKRPLPALALTTDVAVVTALSNDVGFEVVFARQLAAFGRPGDIALALSTSGNSDNLIAALREAARRGMVTAGLAGYTGGQMAELPGLHHLFVVPSSSVHRIQEAQTTIYHALWELTQRELTQEAV
jgi:D-sedoheptulose 7-phosphate isomerase